MQDRIGPSTSASTQENSLGTGQSIKRGGSTAKIVISFAAGHVMHGQGQPFQKHKVALNNPELKKDIVEPASFMMELDQVNVQSSLNDLGKAEEKLAKAKGGMSQLRPDAAKLIRGEAETISGSISKCKDEYNTQKGQLDALAKQNIKSLQTMDFTEIKNLSQEIHDLQKRAIQYTEQARSTEQKASFLEKQVQGLPRAQIGSQALETKFAPE